MNELVRKESIEEICGHRERALELYKIAAETLADAEVAHKRAAAMKGGYASTPYLCSDRNAYGQKPDSFVADMTLKVDRDIWRALINGTPIGSMMDRQERKTFEESLEREPPPITPDTVQATFNRLRLDAGMIFRRGLVNAFKSLSRDYHSNDGFKIGERTVIDYAVTYDAQFGKTFRFNQHAEDNLRDVDRVMHVLDGKPAPDYQQGVCAALRMAFYVKGGPREVSTEYWRVKFFQKGTIHLFALRDDLVRKANKLIAEHFGEVLGTGHEAAKSRAYEPPPKDFAGEDDNYFPTPPEVIERLLDAATILPDDRVLEPSAGEGAIALKIADILYDSSLLTCVEINFDRALKLRETLRDLHKLSLVLSEDFLQSEPRPIYDIIVMNPPFSKERDIRHVLHAYKFLKPYGRLVSVMSAGVRFHSGKLAETFRKVVEIIHGTIEDLPEEAFKASGTGVRTVMVTLNKPGEPS